MKKFLIIFVIFIAMLVSSNHCKNSDKNLSDLHNEVSKKLLSIKKEYPGSQSKIFPVLDQVCKMYQISKNAIKKKKELKSKFMALNKENQTLKTENISLKKEINKLKIGLNTKNKELENKNKALAKNTAILTIINKQKKEMEAEINKLKTEQKELILKTETDKISQNENKEEEVVEENKNIKSSSTSIT